MRLDKFLKVSRLIKRRTLAKEAADKGKISINGKIAKAGTDVLSGDILEVRFGENVVRAKILSTPDFTKKEDAAGIYEII